MEVVLQPPMEIRPGHTLYPPLIISLREEDGGILGVEPLVNTSTGSEINQSHLWAFVQLVPATSAPPAEPASTTTCHRPRLIGPFVDSPHRAGEYGAEHGPRYFIFRHLSITEAGIFRLKVALVDMSCGNTGTISSSCQAFGTTVCCVDTRVIVVDASAPPYLLGTDPEIPLLSE